MVRSRNSILLVFACLFTVAAAVLLQGCDSGGGGGGGGDALPATAATLRFRATVTDVIDDGALDDLVNEGAVVEGTIIYDRARADSDADPNVGVYLHTDSPYGMFMRIGGLVFQTDPDDVFFQYMVVNSDRGDAIVIISDNNLPLSDFLDLGSMSWRLEDQSGEALDSILLPSDEPTLVNWSQLTGLRIAVVPLDDSLAVAEIVAQVTSILRVD